MKQDKANIKKEIEKPTRSLTSDCLNKIGSEVMIQGWIAKIRNHGSLVFIDLRDWEGVIQLVLDKEKTDIPEKVGLEYVVEVLGTVVEREEGFKNEKMLTGNIEVQVSEITVLNESLTPPFPLDGNGFDVSEDIRYKYRYLDIRRKSVRDIIKNRHDLMMSTREWFSDNGFVEIQTPLLTVSSPEGARDYLVPSRIHQGSFYALPQAPQQYKQLLMVGGVDKYFQIAPCFRDEDPRADRHSGEFYQIDTECSFITRDELFHLSEPYFKEVVSKLTEKKIKQYRFPKIKYTEVIEKYGTDKPDLRFEMHLFDLTSEFKESGMRIFEDVESVKAVLVDKTFSKKEIEELTDWMKKEGAKGLAVFAVEDSSLKGHLAEHFSLDIQQKVLDKAKEAGYTVDTNQTIFAVADNYANSTKLTGLVRSRMGDILNLKSSEELAFAWIVDFPMYEWNEDSKKWDFGHNPFSMPQGGLSALKSKLPGEIMAEQFDLVCNGYELASGSIRNHHPKTFIEAFKVVGYTEEETREEFGHMISAFEYGAPPHGGFAVGFDRLMMVLFNVENIREVYAFPKQNAREAMTGAPRRVEKKDLDILGLELKKK